MFLRGNVNQWQWNANGAPQSSADIFQALINASLLDDVALIEIIFLFCIFSSLDNEQSTNIGIVGIVVSVAFVFKSAISRRKFGARKTKFSKILRNLSLIKKSLFYVIDAKLIKMLDLYWYEKVFMKFLFQILSYQWCYITKHFLSSPCQIYSFRHMYSFDFVVI